MLDRLDDRMLTKDNVGETNCCPGGLQVQGKSFKGDLERTLSWQQKMLKQGMKGFVSYHNGVARGFTEYMPAEPAPFPIEAPGAAVLMCYHWETLPGGDEEEHLTQEKRLIDLVIRQAVNSFTGLATLGWEHPDHFPIVMLEELGFRQMDRKREIALMWLPLKRDAREPRLTPACFAAQNLSINGILAIESASSSRCPYSIHNATRLQQIIDELPDEARTRVRHSPHLIDTHEDAVRWAIAPWNWEWAFVNGEGIPIFQVSSDDLRRMIMDRIVRCQQSHGWVF